MADEITYMLGIIAAGFAVNFGLRALPFVLFGSSRRRLPKWVERVGAFISPVIIGGLIVYAYSGSEWRTPWPYVAGVVTVALQLWRRNPLASIIAGTVVYMCLVNCGCSTTEIIGLDAARPSVRLSSQGFSVGDRYVDPKEIPEMLEDYEIPHDRAIHILIDEDMATNLKPARIFMGMLAKAGYTRSVLVTKKHAESMVPEDGR